MAEPDNALKRFAQYVDLFPHSAAAPAPAAPSAAGPPEWIDLAIVGQWLGHPQGPERVQRADLLSIRDYFDRHYRANGASLVVDFEHQSLVAKFTGKPAPAAGWIDELRIAPDGDRLQGHVRWNDQARALIHAREYRHVSPVFTVGGADRVTGQPVGMYLDSVGLTNRPFFSELAPIANSLAAAQPAAGAAAPDPSRSPSQEADMDLQKLSQIWQCTPADAARRLGVPETADAATVANALAARAGAAPPPISSEIANTLGVEPTSDETTIKAAIIALRAPQRPVLAIANALGLPPDVAPEILVDKVVTLAKGDQKDKAVKLIANAIEARKIPPAAREWWEKQALADPEATAQVIATMIPILNAQINTAGLPGPADKPDELTDTEKEAVRISGLTEDEFRKAKTRAA